jgi:hypothetical protein
VKATVRRHAVEQAIRFMKPAGTDHGASAPGAQSGTPAPGFVAYRGGDPPPSADRPLTLWLGGLLLLGVWGLIGLVVYVVGWGWAWR